MAYNTNPWVQGWDDGAISSLPLLPLFDKILTLPSAIVVGSVPLPGIRKSAGTTAASSDGTLSGDVLELFKSR